MEEDTVCSTTVVSTCTRQTVQYAQNPDDAGRMAKISGWNKQEN